MRSKSVDLEINQRNNNTNVNLLTIATLRKETIANICSNISNVRKNRNTNNNGNNNDNVRFLMKNILIIVIMEELVTTIVTIIKLTYRQDSMEAKKKIEEKKVSKLIKNLVR